MTDHTSDNRPEDRASTPDGRPLDDQPRWRRDFPVDWAQDDFVGRRHLLQFMVLTSAAFAAGQGWMAVKAMNKGSDSPRVRLPIATVDELPVGGAKTFHYPEGSTPRLLVRTGARAFVAYDQECTHLQCPVIPAVAQGKLHCPCHNGWFDLHTGEPLAGPPRRALPKVNLDIRGATIFATGVEYSGT